MIRRLTAFGLLSLLAVGLVAVPTIPSFADPVSAYGQGPGLSSLAACIANTHRLDVAVMMDESGSLGYPSDGMPATDPTAQRVPALQQLLAGLASLTNGPTPVSVRVGLSGFSTNAVVVQPFTALTTSVLPKMDALAATFATKNNGPDTDFYSALSAIQQQLAAQAAAAGGQTCQTFVLFTDGIYSFSVRPGLTRSYAPGLSANTQADANALAAAGQRAICEPGGLIDQIRGDGIYAITVGLGPGAGPGAAFLSGVAGAGGCGARPSPGGLFLPAADVGSLIEAFDVAGAELSGGTDVGSTSGTPRPFYVGADLSKVLILIHTTSTTAGVTATLVDPEGQSLSVPSSGNATLDGLSFSVGNQANGYLAIDGVTTSSTAPWVGQWAIATTSAPSSATTSDVLEFPDLVPTLAPGTTLLRGRLSKLVIGLRRLSGAPPLPTEQSAALSMTVEVVDPTKASAQTAVKMTPGTAAGTFSGTYRVPTGDPATSVNLDVTLTSLAPNGSVLTRAQRSFPVSIALPPSYPTVKPSRLNFEGITGGAVGHATVTLIGGATAGCVSFGTFSPRVVPKGLQVPRITVPTGCISVAPHQHRVVVLQLRHRGGGNGLLRGSLSVFVHDAAGQHLRLSIPATASFQLPIHQARRIVLLVVLLLAGILLPLLFMYGLALLGARFRPSGLLRYVDVPVAVTSSSVEATPGPPLDPKVLISHVAPVPEGNRHSRRIQIPGGLLARSFVSINPFGAPTTVVEHPERDVVASNGTERVSGRWRGRISPRLGVAWIFQVDGRDQTQGGEARLHGTLTLLCEETDTEPNPWPKAVAHVTTRLPELCLPLLKEEIAPPTGDTENTSDGDSEQPPDPDLDPRLSLDLFSSPDQ